MIFEHPAFVQYKNEWDRYRHTYEGGRRFVDMYLKKYNVREDDTDFTDRKDMTYCPGFASSSVEEINNTIFSRMPDVTRMIESDSYAKALAGELNGVNYTGSSIDNFVGCEILPELTFMGRVGVYVDMPREVPSIKNGSGTHPYYYIYRAEDIITWQFGDPGSGHEFTKLLLRDNYYKYDDIFRLPIDTGSKFRLLEVTPDGVSVTFLDAQKQQIGEPLLLDIQKIPFVLFKLKHSLLKNVADYQIALMNIESTDVDYARKASFPIYTEQSNALLSLPGNKPEGQTTDEPVSGDHVRDSGTMHGIRYPKGADRPDFIFPPSEPLQVNMAKEAEMKRDIRLLVHLNVADLGNKSVSRESKDFDRQGLENGLSLISLVLEEGERKLAKYWAAYESQSNSKITVSYPRNFDLRTDEDRRREATELLETAERIQSDTFKRTMIKRAINILMSSHVGEGDLAKMYKEIDDAPTTTSDPTIILADYEAGLVGDETASVARGYNEGEIEKAREDHAKRLARIVTAQGGQGGDARGVKDQQIDEPTSGEEKQGKPKRGEA